ncbi:hypothetical protein E5843_02915 [Luteimonas yindakuii]|uniref:hypothetical protein n=1 Tax=Luteimonas yindakuii TaxID=2565782 RepID=UPI0010A59A13|nr:hypothetical protein [Luteimonas yindakuii]QCO66989.1 hypothetical protein E5843_02915 [Luteimonas yindakuii]
MDLDSYIRIYWRQEGKEPCHEKVPRAAECDILEHGPGELAEMIRRRDAWETDKLTQKLFDQRHRVADAERALKVKETKNARENVRIGTNMVAAAQQRLDVLKGKPSPIDHRVFPGGYGPVLVSEGGLCVVKLMRFRCRPAGKPSVYDTKFQGT